MPTQNMLLKSSRRGGRHQDGLLNIFFKQVKKGERFLIVEPGTLSLTRASLFIKFYRRYIWVVIYMELVALQIII